MVLRACAAHHATRLQPGTSHPVWWHTRLGIDSVQPAATGFAVQASARTAVGPVASSRVTFARGLHHACFVSTDVATFAGSVSPTRVEMPAVAFRDLPVFAGAPAWR